MLKVPHTYNEWMKCLDAFRDEKMENEALYAMMQGSIEWQSGVAERFTKSIFDLIEYKLNIMQNNFNNRISKPAKSSREIERNLLYARREFKRLMVFSEIKVFPQELCQHIESYITKTADAMQNSLLDSAKRDRTGVIASLVRKNPVNKFNDVEVKEHSVSQVIDTDEERASSANNGHIGAKRRILF
ncbi:hypothetical protein ACQPUY_06240 [Clostridium nigeriense]|uniref:hypothetical protein n=1 Tax=Clostridium nigeriense TaxID=1805470 RepID=UPI003D32BE04